MTDLLERPTIIPHPPMHPIAAINELARGCIDGYDIAKKLKAQGITGNRMNSAYCPIAIYLSVVTGARVVSVGKQTAYFRHPEQGYLALEFDLPVPVPQFIREFDRGQYTELVT